MEISEKISETFEHGTIYHDKQYMFENKKFVGYGQTENERMLSSQ